MLKLILYKTIYYLKKIIKKCLNKITKGIFYFALMKSFLISAIISDFVI